MHMGMKGFGGMGRMGRMGRLDNETPPLKINDRRMLAWFYKILSPHWYKITIAFLAMLLSTAATLYSPVIIRDIIDKVAVPRNIEPLFGLMALYLGVTVASMVFGACRSIVMNLLGQRFVYKVRMQCYRHIMKLGLDFYQRQRSGDIMSRISNDVGAVETMVVHGTDEVVKNVFHVIAVIAIMFYFDWRAAAIALAPIPIFITSLWLFARYIRPVFGLIRRELGEINVKLQERIAGIQIIKAFAREKPEVDYFEESSRAHWRASAKSIWMAGTFFPALHLITSLGLVVVIWYVARGAALGLGKMSAGTLFLYMSYTRGIYGPIGSLGRLHNMFNQALASIARLFELFDEKPSVRDKKDALELGRVKGEVEIKGVEFKYDTGGKVLKNVSISAAPGEMVAIVGRSGGGKTSLVNLIPRFHDPQKGRILVDGVDVRDVTQESLRRNIGMVLQETFLFNATIKENIRYARPKASEKEIIAAAKAAHAHEFVRKLKDGYDTLIGERGVRLSGGEKQRIAIARAFLVDPRILILDEATSMVDTEAEQIIQKALDKLMKDRTVFIIAHRLSTVRKADKIAVIEGGKIVEQDRHRRLMAKNGLYKEMIARQFLLEEEWDKAEDVSPDMLR